MVRAWIAEDKDIASRETIAGSVELAKTSVSLCGI